MRLNLFGGLMRFFGSYAHFAPLGLAVCGCCIFYRHFEETSKQKPRWGFYVAKGAVVYTHFNLLEVTQVAIFVA